MLFNSYEFVLLFLPLSFVLFWYCGRGITWRLALLTFASYVFYSYWQFLDPDRNLRWDALRDSLRFDSLAHVRQGLWQWRFTLVMLLSTSVDYYASKLMAPPPPVPEADPGGNTPPPEAALHGPREPFREGRLPARPLRNKLLVTLSLVVNIGLLVFFKYSGFFAQIASSVSRALGGGSLPAFELVMPVGISFYTFESMSYVIDVYRGVARPARGYLDYAAFVSMFPHLVAGPIIRYSDILHQFRDEGFGRRGPDWEQVHTGLLLFTMGMAKKVMIADRIAGVINPVWGALHARGSLPAPHAWVAVLGYAYQIYFDFSGYSDMATGLGHLFGVKLPQNFDSPYKAADASDFWRRWHITLSNFLRDYLYIPLGGNRKGRRRQSFNLLLTMLIGGLWHGAAWPFVLWGGWWGLLLALHHLAKRRGLALDNDRPAGLWTNRTVTFLLVLAGWVLFRSGTAPLALADARHMFASLVGLAGPPAGPQARGIPLPPVEKWVALVLACCWLWTNFLPNSFQLAYTVPLRRRYALLAGATLAYCVISFGTKMDFLYFQF